MATVILVRHGRSTANTGGILAGRAVGVHLDEHGRSQADALGPRLAAARPVALVVSPLDRCRQTAEPIAAATGLPIVEEPGLLEVDYGTWQGRSLHELMQEELWPTVQAEPTAVRFPGGEAMAEMAARSAEAVRRHDALVEEAHGPDAVWVAVSHGDILKSVLADALGVPFDLFQRIVVDPASVSIVRYGVTRPTVLGLNTHAGDLSWLATTTGVDQATVGGGAGPAAPASRLG
jgi:probable phosphomutase (TIGR03848 family)